MVVAAPPSLTRVSIWLKGGGKYPILRRNHLPVVPEGLAFLA